MDTLDPEKRRLVMAVLQEQEARLRVAKTGWRWWEIALFVCGFAGFAWIQYQGMQVDAQRPGVLPARPVPFHVVMALVVVPVAFLLVYIHALHRRMDALIGLIGDKALTSRAVEEIRAINQDGSAPSGEASDGGEAR